MIVTIISHQKDFHQGLIGSKKCQFDNQIINFVDGIVFPQAQKTPNVQLVVTFMDVQTRIHPKLLALSGAYWIIKVSVLRL